jgi:uncharacterized small protein (DUF1192 family)
MELMNSEKESETPRTDAIEFRHCPPQPKELLKKHQDAYALSRELERELNASQAEVERLKAQLSRAVAIGEALSSELYFPDFVNELNAFKASLSSP